MVFDYVVKIYLFHIHQLCKMISVWVVDCFLEAPNLLNMISTIEELVDELVIVQKYFYLVRTVKI